MTWVKGKQGPPRQESVTDDENLVMRYVEPTGPTGPNPVHGGPPAPFRPRVHDRG